MRNLGNELDLDVDQFLFPNETKTDFERTFPENSSLLTALKATYDDLSSNGRSKHNMLSTYMSDIGKDLLNNILVNEDTLKMFLEIVLENSSEKLSVVELNHDFPIIITLASHVMAKYALPRFQEVSYLQISHFWKVWGIMTLENWLLLRDYMSAAMQTLSLCNCVSTPKKVVPTSHVIVEVSGESYNWVEQVRTELYENECERVWLVAQDGFTNGIVGLVNCLRKEPGGDQIRCIFLCEDERTSSAPLLILHIHFTNILWQKI
ncbi:fatty acid synthase [Caerostris extrusa]|uniref:Fatty acid synthase n=1 Tax=Caerostris extrusa TaxID=172846 RepID=A0AAV4M6L9_CAEEX|nr:fatty acid synthase [Caerostris extrusa]